MSSLMFRSLFSVTSLALDSLMPLRYCGESHLGVHFFTFPSDYFSFLSLTTDFFPG